jgi:hypothetical protein
MQWCRIFHMLHIVRINFRFPRPHTAPESRCTDIRKFLHSRWGPIPRILCSLPIRLSAECYWCGCNGMQWCRALYADWICFRLHVYTRKFSNSRSTPIHRRLYLSSIRVNAERLVRSHCNAYRVHVVSLCKYSETRLFSACLRIYWRLYSLPFRVSITSVPNC